MAYLDAYDQYLQAKATNDGPAAADAYARVLAAHARSVELTPAQTSQELPPAEQPDLGSTVNVTPESGVVMVRLPGEGGFVPLVAGASVPVGSEVDARYGKVQLTTATASGATQSAVFHGSKFVVRQHDAALTDLVLRGNLGSCPKASGSSALASRARRGSSRRLWGNGEGRFRTRGSHGIATVRGTHWLTEDRCDGTLVVVRRGVVEVRDLAKRRTVTVRAGQRYFARAPRG